MNLKETQTAAAVTAAAEKEAAVKAERDAAAEVIPKH